MNSSSKTPLKVTHGNAVLMVIRGRTCRKLGLTTSGVFSGCTVWLFLSAFASFGCKSPLPRATFQLCAAQFHIELEGTPETSHQIMSNFLQLAERWGGYNPNRGNSAGPQRLTN